MSGSANQFDPNHFDAERPAAFYLEDDSLADLADSVWAVGDRELPVHSQIVAQRSSVLRAVYRIERGSQGEDAECKGRKRIRQEKPLHPPPPPTRLDFAGSSVKDVVLFLRLLYKPEDISAANLGRLGQRLPAVAQLASKYGVRRVLEAAEEWLLAPAPAKTPAQLMTSLALAENLQLDRVRGETIVTIARELTADRRGQPSLSGFLEAAQMGGMSAANLRLLLGALLSALRRAPVACRAHVVEALPAPDAVADWSRLAQGAAGELTWDIEGFVGSAEVLYSPPFEAGGHTWKLQCYPQGDLDAEGHISLYVVLEDPPGSAQQGPLPGASDSSSGEGGGKEGGGGGSPVARSPRIPAGWGGCAFPPSPKSPTKEEEEVQPGINAAARVTVVNQLDLACSIIRIVPVQVYDLDTNSWGYSKFVASGSVVPPSLGFVTKGGSLRLKVEVLC